MTLHWLSMTKGGQNQEPVPSASNPRHVNAVKQSLLLHKTEYTERIQHTLYRTSWAMEDSLLGNRGTVRVTSKALWSDKYPGLDPKLHQWCMIPIPVWVCSSIPGWYFGLLRRLGPPPIACTERAERATKSRPESKSRKVRVPPNWGHIPRLSHWQPRNTYGRGEDSHRQRLASVQVCIWCQKLCEICQHIPTLYPKLLKYCTTSDSINWQRN